MTLHITNFGGNGSTNASTNVFISALSDFRAQQLLPKLQAIDSKIVAVRAQYLHVVATAQALSAQQRSQLAALLTYGEPCKPQTGKKPEEIVFIVSPRLGTVSPWEIGRAHV